MNWVSLCACVDMSKRCSYNAVQFWKPDQSVLCVRKWKHSFQASKWKQREPAGKKKKHQMPSPGCENSALVRGSWWKRWAFFINYYCICQYFSFTVHKLTHVSLDWCTELLYSSSWCESNNHLKTISEYNSLLFLFIDCFFDFYHKRLNIQYGTVHIKFDILSLLIVLWSWRLSISSNGEGMKLNAEFHTLFGFAVYGVV